MQRLFEIFGILLFVVGGGCVTKSVKQTNQASMACRLETESSSIGTQEEMLRALKEYSNSDASDAFLTKKMLDILEPLLHNEEGARERLPKLIEVLGELLDHYEKQSNADNILCAYHSALRWISTLQKLGVNDDGLNKRVHEAVGQFPDRFPKTSRAMQVYALHLSLVNANSESVIGAYYECLKLDPSNKVCRSGYDRFVEDYSRVFCGAEEISKGIEFYVGRYARDGKFNRKIKFENQKIFVEKVPALTSSDIESLSPSKNEYGEDEILVVFFEGARARLANLTENNIGRPLAIVFKSEILTAPVIRATIKDGRAIITEGIGRGGDKSLFSRLCKRPTLPELPAHLKL